MPMEQKHNKGCMDRLQEESKVTFTDIGGIRIYTFNYRTTKKVLGTELEKPSLQIQKKWE